MKLEKALRACAKGTFARKYLAPKHHTDASDCRRLPSMTKPAKDPNNQVRKPRVTPCDLEVKKPLICGS